MSDSRRWQEAQHYESMFWENTAHQIDSGDTEGLHWYRWRAEQLMQRLNRLHLQRLTSGQAKVIEIGSGPVGLCTFFPGSERTAIDPLMDTYSRYPEFAKTRDPGVEYIQAMGERLPCPTAHYDLAIIENCIDHTQDIDGVMRELSRVLKPNGVLYLTVNSRCRIGYFIHRALSRAKIDRGHPHTFTPNRIVDLIRRSGFQPTDLEVGSYLGSSYADLKSGRPRDMAKALLGVSEYLVSIVAEHDAPVQAMASKRDRSHADSERAIRTVA